MEIERWRSSICSSISFAHIKKPGATRSPEVLAPGRGQHIAAQGIHVQVDLSRRLAGIEQERNARRPSQLAHSCGRLDQASVGGHDG